MKKVLFLIGLISLSLLAYGNKKVELSLNLQEGKTYTTNTSIDLKALAAMFGVSVDLEAQVQVTTMTKVLKKNASDYLTEVTFVDCALQFNINSEAFALPADKKDSINTQVNSVLKGLQGQSIQIKVSNKGVLLEVIGLDKILANLSPNSESNQLQILDFSNSKATMGILFPAKAVQVGSTWKVSHKEKTQGIVIEVETAYKLEEITADYILISENITFKMPKKSKLTVSEQQLDMYFNGNSTAQVKIDPKTCWIQDSSSNLKFNMKITFHDKVKKTQVEMEMNMDGSLNTTNK